MISKLQETLDQATGRVAYQFRRLSAGLWRRPMLSAGLLLTPPLGWFIFIYLAALAALFISAFWTVDSFTGEINRHWTLANFHTIATSDIYQRIAVRTILMAAAWDGVIERWVASKPPTRDMVPEWLTAEYTWTANATEACVFCRKDDAKKILDHAYPEAAVRHEFNMDVKVALMQPTKVEVISHISL